MNEPNDLGRIGPSEDLIERLQAFAKELHESSKYPGSEINDALDRIRRFMSGEIDDVQ